MTNLPAMLSIPDYDYVVIENYLESHPGRGKPDAEPIIKEKGFLMLANRTPMLVVDPKCRDAKYHHGVVTVPPSMETAAKEVLNGIAHGTRQNYKVLEQIKKLHSMANG